MLRFLKEKITDSAEEAGIYTFLNPYSYIIARREQALLKEFDGIYCDGNLLRRFLALAGLRVRRVSFDMTSLAPQVLSEAAGRGNGVFFIGAAPGQVDAAVEALRREFPRLQVAGFRHGYFESDDQRRSVLERIAASEPKVVIVGMGTPLQERFLVDLKATGWQGRGYTCGGFLHQTAARGVSYYPRWMNKLNLRWLYRIWDEPKLAKRYLVYYPWFSLVFLADLLRARMDAVGRG